MAGGLMDGCFAEQTQLLSLVNGCSGLGVCFLGWCRGGDNDDVQFYKTDPIWWGNGIALRRTLSPFYETDPIQWADGCRVSVRGCSRVLSSTLASFRPDDTGRNQGTDVRSGEESGDEADYVVDLLFGRLVNAVFHQRYK